MRAQKPEELFDSNGKLSPDLKELAPVGKRRMSANPHANGGILKRALRLPDFRQYAVEVRSTRQLEAENMRPLGTFLRDVMKRNMENFRVFGPDETTSNKLDAIYAAARSSGSKNISPRTPMAPNWRPTAVSWRCSASTRWRECWKAIC